MLNVQPDITDLTDYNGEYGHGESHLLDYALNKLTPDLAIAVTKLFYPDFVVHQNRVFLAFRFDKDNFDMCEKQLDGDLAAVERVINHIHVAADLLTIPFENATYQTIQYFGTVLLQSWKAILLAQFPDRQFQFSGEKDGDMDDFVITFWQMDVKP